MSDDRTPQPDETGPPVDPDAPEPATVSSSDTPVAQPPTVSGSDTPVAQPLTVADEGAEPLARAERERDEYLDALRRERAEFENFRKRTVKERMDALDRGAEQLAAGLLTVLDSFGLALDAAAKSSDEQLAKGVELVYAQFVTALEQAGLAGVEGVGAAFDPSVHEALLQVEAAEALGRDVDEPEVVEVLRRGYRFKGRVLRPAAVKVAR
jgi:molecular chaperone GrpE